MPGQCCDDVAALHEKLEQLRSGRAVGVAFENHHRARTCNELVGTLKHIELAAYDTSTLIYRKEQMLVPVPTGAQFPLQAEAASGEAASH